MENRPHLEGYAAERESEPRNFLTVISDTQGRNADELREFGQKVIETNPDNIVHLGDLFLSKSANDLLGKIKRKEYSENDLTEEQRKVYDRHVKTVVPARAIFRALFETDPELRHRDEDETRAQAEALFSTLAQTGKPIHIIPGNVETGYSWRMKAITEEAEKLQNVNFYTEPAFAPQEGGKGFVFWPSVNLELTQVDYKKAIKDIVGQVKESGTREIFLFAHEYLFKGPKPEVYKQKLAEKGLADKTHIVPWYMPNPTRLELQDLMRQLYAQGCSIKFMYGHIEDDPEITRNVLGSLNMDEQGVVPEFPLVGLASKAAKGLKKKIHQETRRRGDRKASVSTYQVPDGGISIFKESNPGELEYSLIKPD